MFTSPRIPCDRGKHPMIIWILVTILIGLLCEVRDTVAVHCEHCQPERIDDKCYSEDNGGYDKNEDGCFIYRITYHGDHPFFHSGSRGSRNGYLDCIRIYTGLYMGNGRCLRTNLTGRIVREFTKCMDVVRVGLKPSDHQLMDMRICSCNGNNCNKADIWKPDEFKFEKATEPEGVGTGGGGATGGGPGATGGGEVSGSDGSAYGGGGVKTAASSFIITIGLVVFSLCPFQ